MRRQGKKTRREHKVGEGRPGEYYTSNLQSHERGVRRYDTRQWSSRKEHEEEEEEEEDRPR